MTLRDTISRLRHFLVELKRRKVYQIGAVYAAVAFVIWQAAEVAFPAVGLPNAAVTFVVVVSVLGFPIALVLAWALEVSPEGVAVKREAGDEREPGEPATAPPAAGQRQVNELAERDFLITEEICRKLDRRTLDPQMIGDRLQYVDNQVESDVLVAYLHGLGLDGYAFGEILETLPYRAVAPTLYGFERTAHRRIPLSLADHVVLIREFLRGTIQRLRPRTTVLVGFSVGADLGFRVIETPQGEAPLPLDGYLAIGPNLSLDTCFASSLVARITTDDPSNLLADLAALGRGAHSLDEWLNVHDYLVQVLRKFQDDIEPLRRVSEGFVAPWRDPDSNPFIEWYRDASARVTSLLCVFSDTPEENTALERIKLQNLDAGVLGEGYRPGSLVLEPHASHFDLIERDRHLGHLERLLGVLR